MNTVTVLVAYHTPAWIKVAVTSYGRVFPDRLLVVDNNPQSGEPGWDPSCEAERQWLRRHPQIDVVAGPEPRTHGSGLNAALAWCRQHGTDVMIHIEPDCVVTGPEWRNNLLDAIRRGSWMAGAERKRYGPIHATPSAWLVSRVQDSFDAQPRAGDQHHPRFHELIDWERLKNSAIREGSWTFFEAQWDTAQKAWFRAAIVDRAALVETPDFKHYWLGSTRNRFSDEQLIATFPELAAYVD